MLVNREDAEDILQEAFIQAFRRLDTFRGESSFGTWLKKIVINRCLDFLKKRKLSFMDSDEEKIPDSQDELLDEEQISPDMIHECIQSLPEGARVVVNLYLMEGFSHKDSAKMLGITESTAKTQYHRAKHLLRERINEKLLYEKA